MDFLQIIDTGDLKLLKCYYIKGHKPSFGELSIGYQKALADSNYKMMELLGAHHNFDSQVDQIKSAQAMSSLFFSR
jgi:hypothetical protein